MDDAIGLIIALVLLALLVGGIILPIVALVVSIRTRNKLNQQLSRLQGSPPPLAPAESPGLSQILQDLTARVARLESALSQRPTVAPADAAKPEFEAQPKPPAPPPPPVVPSAGTFKPSSQPVSPPQLSTTKPTRTLNAQELESIIGRRWLGWAAVALILFATAFFLKYAFDNRWIGELGRVAIGVTAGATLAALGYRYHKRKWRVFSQILTAGGVVLLYLSAYASFGYYHLATQRAAFFYIAILIAEAAGLALLYDAGILYIRAEYPDSVRIVNDAIAELHAAGLLGKNIAGSGFNFALKSIKGAGAYICGEETALLASLEGQRPEVRVRPPFPTIEGLFRKPTIVNNVETFANLHAILTRGGKAYATIGTPQSTGPKLLSLDSNFVRPGICEVAMGTPLRTVVDLAGGWKTGVKAIQVGGPLGGIVPVSHIDALTVDFESFKKAGFLLGHAGVVSIPASFPMIEYIEHLFKFTSDESCGKCFPCRLGSTRGKELIAKARTDSTYKIDRTLINDLLETMEQTSLCALGGGVPLPIKNALEHFGAEMAGYFKA